MQRNVRFGSKADMCGAKRHVRFTPNSDRESGLPQKVVSALTPEADMCAALVHVSFGPIADIRFTAAGRSSYGRRRRVQPFLARADEASVCRRATRFGFARPPRLRMRAHLWLPCGALVVLYLASAFDRLLCQRAQVFAQDLPHVRLRQRVQEAHLFRHLVGGEFAPAVRNHILLAQHCARCLGDK